MFTRSAKLLLLAGIALLLHAGRVQQSHRFRSNYEFIRHVLSMDTTIPGNHGIWRAMTSPGVHLVFYWMIIAWELVTMILAWWGSWVLARALRQPADVLQCGQTRGGDGADALAADVARGLSGCGRGVVPDVAVAYLEWSGRSIPHVRGRGIRAAAAVAAGHRHTAVRFYALTTAGCLRRTAYQASPAAIYDQVDVGKPRVRYVGGGAQIENRDQDNHENRSHAGRQLRSANAARAPAAQTGRAAATNAYAVRKPKTESDPSRS